MRILIVENYPNAHAGLVGQALREAGARIEIRFTHRGEPLPAEPDGYDGLVVLGGEQNALADDAHSYLPALAALTRAFGERDKAVLGICLGAQLVARGHGATNLLGGPFEFGWGEVRPTAAAARDPVLSVIGDGAPLFHWHSDTFTLPPGAVHLATSDRTAHQAFRIGRAVYGIQFHFEADRTLVERWNVEFADQIAAHTPDWPERYPGEAARHAEAADAAGAAVARAWTELLR
jgi:GMP synthase (glutamine-hydrolysing)